MTDLTDTCLTNSRVTGKLIAHFNFLKNFHTLYFGPIFIPLNSSQLLPPPYLPNFMLFLSQSKAKQTPKQTKKQQKHT